jgi:hypothetical protein
VLGAVTDQVPLTCCRSQLIFRQCNIRHYRAQRTRMVPLRGFSEHEQMKQLDSNPQFPYSSSLKLKYLMRIIKRTVRTDSV